MNKIRLAFICVLIFTLPLAGCTGKFPFSKDEEQARKQPSVRVNEKIVASKSNKISDKADTTDRASNRFGMIAKKEESLKKEPGIQVVAEPETIPVLVNKVNKLPDDYAPSDLVYPDIPFIFEQMTSKRQMRKEAAAAIEKLFAGAEVQGIQLLGVSAYRSHAAQESLFNYYVNRDGYEAARTYSALPGTSEHETGLAIDVTGGDGKCAAEECFAGSAEAEWLQEHVAEYGFIIRYPEGKDSVTGYTYEPWHLRYVGEKIAKTIMNNGITLEEYYNTQPVNN